MAEAARRSGPVLLWAALAALAAILSMRLVAARLPAAEWLHPAAGVGADLDRALVLYGQLPRVAVAIFAGAALGLAGALLQRVLRNPIADPSTLGISAGAQLALIVAMLHAPALLESGRTMVALGGAALAMAIVLALTWRRRLEPVAVVLAGMVVSLTAAGLNGALILWNGEYLMSLFIWGGGSLTQQDWGPALDLAATLAAAAAGAALLLRPLAVLGLDDAQVRSLGVALNATRLAVLALAVWVAARVTAEVGIIGFVGLAAPALARLSGARTQRQILLTAPLIGATLLWLTDGAVQLAAGGHGEMTPTGAATALLGGPFLLWMLPRLRLAARPSAPPQPTAPHPVARPALLLAGLAALLPPLAWLAIAVGQDPGGWHVAHGDLLAELLPWRLPRATAALAAGAMLGAAGTITQRLTGNPLGSPEVLGVSAGAGLGLAVVLFAVAGPDRGAQLLGAASGAGLALAVILLIGGRASIGPERLLLAGIAIGAFCSAALNGAMATGDVRAFQLLAWITGATHQIGPADAWLAAAAALVLLAPLPLAARWLEILPLGTPFARALGVPPAASRVALVALAAMLTAAACLIVGPLSFVGLIAPHLARLAGLTRALGHLAGAVLIGGMLMLGADWLARTVAFPYQLPVGLLASILGGPYLMWFLTRRPARAG